MLEENKVSSVTRKTSNNSRDKSHSASVAKTLAKEKVLFDIKKLKIEAPAQFKSKF